MTDYFLTQKQEILNYLHFFLDKKKSELDHLQPNSRVVLDQIYSFTAAGKNIRGSLVGWLGELLPIPTKVKGTVLTQDAIKIGAAVEMLESLLLIHDDIMDQDRVRRGQAAIFAQYEAIAQQQKLLNPTHYGIGMGLCVGDIIGFLVQEIMADLESNAEIVVELVQLFGRESTQTGLAQMQEFEVSASPQIPSEDAVLSIYIHKTARYTFCLPLLAAAALTQQPQPIRAILDELGETLGLLFQIKDDEIGLFGDPKQTGKPSDSDIREGKKTLFYLYAMELAAPEVKEKLQDIFGNQNLTPAMAEYVRQVVIEVGAKTRTDQKLVNLEQKALTLISSLGLSSTDQGKFEDFVKYNLLRKK